MSDDEVLEFNLIENVMREDLTEVEKGRCCKRLLEDFPNKYPNISALSRNLGINPNTPAKWIQNAEFGCRND